MLIHLHKTFAAVILLLCLTASAVNAVPAPSVAADANGDPLPPGVIARLGTLRLRHICTALAWAPDGQTLASGGNDGTIRIWDAASGKQVRQCSGLKDANIHALTYLPDGKTLVSKGNDNTIRVWNLAAGDEIRTLYPAQPQAAALVPGEDEDALIELCTDNTVHVWDMTTGRESSHLELSRGKRQISLALSPDGKRVAGWSLPNALTAWDATTGKELFHATTKSANLVSLVFSRDGKTLTGSGAPGQIQIWDANSGKELHYYEGVAAVHGLAFSSDGKTIAGVGDNGAPRLWNLETGKEQEQFEAPPARGRVFFAGDRLALSPDGKIAAAAYGSAIHFWSVETGKLLQRFTGHTAAVEDMQFSADGRGLVSWGQEGKARLCYIGTAKEMGS